MTTPHYVVAHDPRGPGWVVLDVEGRQITQPHPDEEYTRDRAAALDMARQWRQSRGVGVDSREPR